MKWFPGPDGSFFDRGFSQGYDCTGADGCVLAHQTSFQRYAFGAAVNSSRVREDHFVLMQRGHVHKSPLFALTVAPPAWQHFIVRWTLRDSN